MTKASDSCAVARVSRCTASFCFFIVVCVVTHLVALQKLELRDLFLNMNPRTVHNIRLIEFVNSNSYLVASYFLMFWGALAFSVARGHPAWSRWLTFLAFSAPCWLYVWVCAYINGKLLG
jgi:hypothetical protein